MPGPVDSDHLSWLEESGQKVQLTKYENAGCTCTLLWLFAFLFAILVVILKGGLWWVPPALVLAAVVYWKIAVRRFYREIFCPECGYNPTRRKADGKPRLDRDKVLKQLRRYPECPECHGEGDGGP